MKTKAIKFKYAKILILILLSILVYISAIIFCCKYLFTGQLKQNLKVRLYNKVEKNEDKLIEFVEEYQDDKLMPKFIYRGFNKKINDKVLKKKYKDKYKEFIEKWNLLYIRKNEDRDIVEFTINSPLTNILWDDYMYGFYYNKKDKASNVTEYGEECEEEFETLLGFWKYRYRTEKIIDNWWFYERTTVY